MGLGGKQRERCRETARSGAGLGMPEPKCRAVGERAPRPHPPPLPPPLSGGVLPPPPGPTRVRRRIAWHRIARGRGRTQAVRGDAGRCGGTLTSPLLPPAQTRRRLSAGSRSVGFCVGFVLVSFGFNTTFIQLPAPPHRDERSLIFLPVDSFFPSLTFFHPPRQHNSWHHRHCRPPSRGLSVPSPHTSPPGSLFCLRWQKLPPRWGRGAAAGVGALFHFTT